MDTSTNEVGVVTIRRRDRNQLALPGGFVDHTDKTWRHAAVREMREECNIDISEHSDNVVLLDVVFNIYFD